MLNIFLYSCTLFKNDVNDMFNYVGKDILIDNFEYMTFEYIWQAMLTDIRYTDFNMWVLLGLLVECLTCYRKTKHCVVEINLIIIL